ncbi:MAG: hypothetical protein KF878_28795 [Planctomycetes bacterium]|nr:hypothetical protein [Planctomycetota bacterium]
MARPGRHGFTLIEVVMFVWLLAWLVAGASWGGAQSPWLVVPGLLAGLLAAAVLPLVILVPLDLLERRRRPRLPPCFARGCRTYAWWWRDGREGWRCGCGDEYALRDGRFLRVVDGDVELRYMRRDARGRWVPDRE